MKLDEEEDDEDDEVESCMAPPPVTVAPPRVAVAAAVLPLLPLLFEVNIVLNELLDDESEWFKSRCCCLTAAR